MMNVWLERLEEPVVRGHYYEEVYPGQGNTTILILLVAVTMTDCVHKNNGKLSQ